MKNTMASVKLLPLKVKKIGRGACPQASANPLFPLLAR